MPRTATIGSLSLLLTMPFFAGGCVQQEKYDQLLMSHRSLEEQVIRTEDERDVARSNLDTVRAELNRATNELDGAKSRFGETEASMAKMSSDYDELLRRVSAWDFGPLPAEMSSALEALATQYPDMLTFDAKRGMLRFASDFTFDLGSAELKGSASAGLAKLAGILNSDTARSFEVRVIGHTDNVRIANAATRAKHPTNWHLSAHRAISVGEALVSSGVAPLRLQVAGYGEYRPVAPNPARGGSAQNRRVEIFLLPMPELIEGDAAPVANVATPATVNDEPMK